MLWTDSWFKIQVGHRVNGDEYSLQPNSQHGFAFDDYMSVARPYEGNPFNPGNQGEFVFQLSDGVFSNAVEQRFVDWINSESTGISADVINGTDCPCTLRQAFLDGRYVVEDRQQWDRIRLESFIPTL